MPIYKGLIDYYHADNLSAQLSENIKLEFESSGFYHNTQNTPIFDFSNQSVALQGGSFMYQRDLINFAG